MDIEIVLLIDASISVSVLIIYFLYIPFFHWFLFPIQSLYVKPFHTLQDYEKDQFFNHLAVDVDFSKLEHIIMSVCIGGGNVGIHWHLCVVSIKDLTAFQYNFDNMVYQPHHPILLYSIFFASFFPFIIIIYVVCIFASKIFNVLS